MADTRRSKALPYGRQDLDDDDIAAVVSVLRGDWLTTGPAVATFDRDFATAVGARYAAACSNGTAGLHLAMLALGIGSGDTAIVPAITFAATANAARYVGANVVFADVDPQTGLMRPEHLYDALARCPGRGRRVALPVHLNGQCADLPGLAAVAARHDTVLVDDAAHAVGSVYQRADGTKIYVGSGTDAVMSVFSLHPVKTITMGEGGVVTTNDERLHQRLIRLRNHGIERDPSLFQEAGAAFDGDAVNPWYYEISELGLNYRATDIQCALGASQLRKLRSFVAQRQRLADVYATALSGASPHLSPVPTVGDRLTAWHLAVVRIDFRALQLSRRLVMERLAAKGVGTQVHYIPVYRHPYYQKHQPTSELPGAEAYYAQCLSLPLFSSMTEADAHYVADALLEVCGLQKKAT